MYVFCIRNSDKYVFTITLSTNTVFYPSISIASTTIELPEKGRIDAKVCDPGVVSEQSFGKKRMACPLATYRSRRVSLFFRRIDILLHWQTKRIAGNIPGGPGLF